MKKNVLKRGLATLTGLSLMASSLVNFPHIILADDSAEVVEAQTQDETVLEDAQIEQDVVTESSSEEQTEQESEEVTQEETEVTESSSMQEDTTEEVTEEQQTTNTSVQDAVDNTVSSEQQEKIQVVEEIEELIAPKSLENLRDYIKDLQDSDLVNFSQQLKDAKDISLEEENDTKVLHIDGRLYVLQEGADYENDLEAIQQRLIAQREEKDGIATYEIWWYIDCPINVIFKTNGKEVKSESSTIRVYTDKGDLLTGKASMNLSLPTEYKDYTIEDIDILGDINISWFVGNGYRSDTIPLSSSITDDKASATISGSHHYNGSFVSVPHLSVRSVPDIVVNIKSKSKLNLVTEDSDVVDSNTSEIIIENLPTKSPDATFEEKDFATAEDEVYLKLAEELIEATGIDLTTTPIDNLQPQEKQALIEKVKAVYQVEGWYTEPNMTIGGKVNGERYYYTANISETGDLTSNGLLATIDKQTKMPSLDSGYYIQCNDIKVLNLYPRITTRLANLYLDLQGGTYKKVDDVNAYPPQENKIYTVNNGGTTPPEYTVTNLEATKYITAPSAPTKSGYRFDGWELCYGKDINNLQSTGQLYQPGQPISQSQIASEMTLKATWTKLTAKVTYDLDGGTFTTVPSTLQDNSGNYITIDDYLITKDYTIVSEEPTKEGYKFNGWQLANAQGTEIKNPSDSFNLTGATTLKAIWTPYKYEVTFDFIGENIDNPGNATAPTTNLKSLVITEETDAVVNQGIVTLANNKSEININLDLVQKPYKQNYEFLGWILDGTANNAYITNYTLPITADGTAKCTFKAVYKTNTNLIELDNNGGIENTTVTKVANNTLADKKVGDEVTFGDLPQVTKEGYVLTGWKDIKNGQLLVQKTKTTRTQPTTTTGITLTNEKLYLQAQWSPLTVQVSYPEPVQKEEDKEQSEEQRRAIVSQDVTKSFRLTDMFAPGFTFPVYSIKNTKILGWELVVEDKQGQQTYTATLNDKGQIVDSNNIDITQKCISDIQAYLYPQAGYTDAEVAQKLANLKFTVNTIIGEQVAVPFDLDGGEFGYGEANARKPVEISFDKGAQIPVAFLPTPTKEGYSFTNWTVTGATVKDGKFEVTDKVRLKANYTPNKLNLTIHSNDGTYTQEQRSRMFNLLSTQTNTIALASVEQPTRDGYDFAGWEFNGQEQKPDAVVTLDKTKDNILVAQWVEQPKNQGNQGNSGNTIGGGSGAGTTNPSVPNTPNTPNTPNVPTVPQNPDGSNSNNGNNSNGTNGSNGSNGTDNSNGTNGADSSNGSDNAQSGNGSNTVDNNANGDVNNNVNDNVNDTNKDVSDDTNNDNILANLDESEENEINSIFGNMFDDLFSNFSSLFASSEFIQQNLLANGENENSNNQMFITGLENSDNGQDNNGTGGSNSDKESFIKSKVLKPFFGFGANKIVTTFAWLLLLLVALIITYVVKKQIFSNKEENAEEDTNVIE